MKIPVSVLLSGAALLALHACGSGGGPGGGCDAADRLAYPEGPYETGVDAVIADLAFTTQQSGTLTFQDIRAQEGNDLLFLATGAGWCEACKQEQPTLQAWHESYGSSGLVVMVAVYEDEYNQPAGAAEAIEWVESQQVTFTVVADPEFVLAPYFPNGDTTVQPLNLIIDLCAMTMIKRSIGSDPSASEAIIEAHL